MGLYLGLGADEDYRALDREHAARTGENRKPRWPELTGWRRAVDGLGLLAATITALFVFDRWWHQILAAIALTLAIHIAAVLLEMRSCPDWAERDAASIVTIVGLGRDNRPPPPPGDGAPSR